MSIHIDREAKISIALLGDLVLLWSNLELKGREVKSDCPG
jgi:hypothetical protein